MRLQRIIFMAVLPLALAMIVAGVLLHPPATHIQHAGLAPSPAHPLGTTPYGHDTLLLVVFATARSAAEAVWATIWTVIVGAVVGVTAASARDRPVDRLQSVFARLLDALGAFLLAACLASIAPRLTTWQLGLLLSLVAWPTVSNVIRGETLQVLRTDYVEASRALGAGPAWIARYHVLPAVIDRVLPLIFAVGTGYVAVFGGLAFLGVGLSTEFSLGFILYDSRAYLKATPWYFASAFGGFILLLTLLATCELALKRPPAQVRSKDIRSQRRLRGPKRSA